MDDKTYHITTFGCQMNERDSETLAGMLAEMGYQESPFRSRAQVVIFNTCSVRENADKRFFGTLGQLKNLRLANPEMLVAVCGCMMQQQHVVDTLKRKYPWVDLVFGTHNIHEFPRLMGNVLAEKSKLVATWEDGGEIAEGLPALRKYPFKAFVNITYGCNNFCTYCIVPYTRGRERSRRPEDILAEARHLAAEGVKEITLLGQNVNSYLGGGAGPANRDGVGPGSSGGLAGGVGAATNFPELIYALNEVEGLERIRFMTSHPKDLSDQLIQAYRGCQKLCRHIHLPVQSGSTEILRRMNRRYSKEDYLALVEKLRAAVPDIAITTDIIVGFPGETEADFEETLDLVEKVRFDSAFTFLYSIRQGTPAASYSEQVPESVKHQRFNRLVDGVNAIAAEKNLACVGRVFPVLAEGPSKTGSRNQSGRTAGHKLVNFSAPEEVTGQIVPVLITAANTFSLEGEAGALY